MGWDATGNQRRGREEKINEHDRRELNLGEVGKKRWRS